MPTPGPGDWIGTRFGMANDYGQPDSGWDVEGYEYSADAENSGKRCEHCGQQFDADLQLESLRIACENLEKQIGAPLEGHHPDERLPRAKTWHEERANWTAEVDRLRIALATVEAENAHLREAFVQNQILRDTVLEKVRRERECYRRLLLKALDAFACDAETVNAVAVEIRRQLEGVAP